MKIFRYMVLFTAMLLSVGSILAQTKNKKATTDTVVVLNKADFFEKIYNYEKNPTEWIYEGNLPCIIDFYADWCMPCRKVAPILKELATEYKGQVIIYKINVDKEKELATAFGISSIPTFLFIPAKGTPQLANGVLPRESFVEVIEKFLLNKEDRAELVQRAKK